MRALNLPTNHNSCVIKRTHILKFVKNPPYRNWRPTANQEVIKMYTNIYSDTRIIQKVLLWTAFHTQEQCILDWFSAYIFFILSYMHMWIFEGIEQIPISGICYVTNLAAVGIFWRKQMTTMIGFYDVSEIRKSLIDFWEIRHLRFLG